MFFSLTVLENDPTCLLSTCVKCGIENCVLRRAYAGISGSSIPNSPPPCVTQGRLLTIGSLWKEFEPNQEIFILEIQFLWVWGEAVWIWRLPGEMTSSSPANLNLGVRQDLDREDSCLGHGELCRLVERQQERGGISETLQEWCAGFSLSPTATLHSEGPKHCCQPQVRG